MTSADFQEILEYLASLKEEIGISKKFKEKVDQIITLLQKDSPFVVEKALLILDELNTVDLSSYHRTKVWEVASMLESALVH